MIIACRQFMRKYWEIVEYMQMLNSIYIFMSKKNMAEMLQLSLNYVYICVLNENLPALIILKPK